MEKQGVVTYMLPVEAFVTGIKIYDWQRNVLDHLIVPSKALDHLIFLWANVQIAAVHSWSFDCCSLEVTLIPWSALKKSFDHLIPSCKCFYMDHTSGYTPRKGLI